MFPHVPDKPTVRVGIGAGIEGSTISLGMDSTDDAGMIVGSLTGLTGETTVIVTFATPFIKRPSAVIVTNAFRELSDWGNYCVIGWDNKSFTISHNMSFHENPTQVRPLYYYMVAST